MNFYKSAIAGAFLCATAACAPEHDQQQISKNVEVVQDTTDWSQPVDRAVLTVRVRDGVDVEMMSFGEEPITLGVCWNLGLNSVVHSDYPGTGSSVTCLNNGQKVGAYKFE